MISTLLAAGAFEPAPASSALQCSGYNDDDDFLGALELGAAYPFRQPVRQRIPAAMARNMGARVPRNYLYPQDPGAPSRGLKLQPLGLGQVAFTATSGTLLSMTALPQRAFKPKRLVIAIARTGTTATGLVTVTQATVGQDNMLAGSGALAADAFAATAFDVNIEWAPATPGIQIVVQLSISAAPTAPDVVNCAGVMFGASYG